MIYSIRIENFKCFRECVFEFRPLTLLAGFNGSGKSSLLQALLMMRQALVGGEDHVRLNGPYFLRLGQAVDVLHHESTDKTIRFIAESTHGKRRCSFEVPGDLESGLILEISECEPKGGVQKEGADLLADLFNYLHAERLGPRDFTELDSTPARRLSVGPRGEFVAHVLVEHERQRVSPGRLHPDSGENELLRQQVELWMRSTAPNLEVLPNRLPDTSLATLRFKHRGVAQEWLRPPNTGFGISYSLPIIVAGLLAPPGTLFIVENPEAHLHPAGQSSLGSFLAKIAADGVVMSTLATVNITSGSLTRTSEAAAYSYACHGEEQKAVGCLCVRTAESLCGRLNVQPTDGETRHLHFICDAAGKLDFYRETPEVEDMLEEPYVQHGKLAFPDLYLHPELGSHFKNFQARYREVRHLVTKHLAFLNDHFEEIFKRLKRDPHSVSQEAHSRGVNLSGDSPGERANAQKRRRRTVSVDNFSIYCSWHTKIFLDHDRIYFRPATAEIAAGRLVVGIFHQHL
jgi:predicted ATPase